MPPLLKENTIEIGIAFKKRNQKKLRKLNDHILRSAVIEFSKPWYILAVLSYVLGKITSKPRYLKKEMEKFMFPIEKCLDDLAKNADRYDEIEWTGAFANLELKIKNLESGDPRFINGLMTKGKLKVAATLYAQGISLGLAAEMTGMNKQDVQNYAGKTMMFDRVKEEQTILERMKNARQLIHG